nr:hypothetical protein Iba_chr12fCG12190 [Ipomoea batatas]
MLSREGLAELLLLQLFLRHQTFPIMPSNKAFLIISMGTLRTRQTTPTPRVEIRACPRAGSPHRGTIPLQSLIWSKSFRFNFFSGKERFLQETEINIIACASSHHQLQLVVQPGW